MIIISIMTLEIYREMDECESHIEIGLKLRIFHRLYSLSLITENNELLSEVKEREEN